MENVCMYDVYRECGGVLGDSLFPGMGRNSSWSAFAAFAPVCYRLAFTGDYVHGMADQIHGISGKASAVCRDIPCGDVGVRVEGAVVSGREVWKLAGICGNLFGNICRNDGRV